eukprot:GHVL01024147.1.p1 GENE.GHVL01024147.1~~GHVL01024147.1.p1  ORF type:complete len:795 (+),score=95.26 GHVL01024147.1:22-2406(+)
MAASLESCLDSLRKGEVLTLRKLSVIVSKSGAVLKCESTYKNWKSNVLASLPARDYNTTDISILLRSLATSNKRDMSLVQPLANAFVEHCGGADVRSLCSIAHALSVLKIENRDNAAVFRKLGDALRKNVDLISASDIASVSNSFARCRYFDELDIVFKIILKTKDNMTPRDISTVVNSISRFPQRYQNLKENALKELEKSILTNEDPFCAIGVSNIMNGYSKVLREESHAVIKHMIPNFLKNVNDFSPQSIAICLFAVANVRLIKEVGILSAAVTSVLPIALDGMNGQELSLCLHSFSRGIDCDNHFILTLNKLQEKNRILQLGEPEIVMIFTSLSRMGVSTKNSCHPDWLISLSQQACTMLNLKNLGLNAAIGVLLSLSKLGVFNKDFCDSVINAFHYENENISISVKLLHALCTFQYFPMMKDESNLLSFLFSKIIPNLDELNYVDLTSTWSSLAKLENHRSTGFSITNDMIDSLLNATIQRPPEDLQGVGVVTNAVSRLGVCTKQSYILISNLHKQLYKSLYSTQFSEIVWRPRHSGEDLSSPDDQFCAWIACLANAVTRLDLLEMPEYHNFYRFIQPLLNLKTPKNPIDEYLPTLGLWTERSTALISASTVYISRYAGNISASWAWYTCWYLMNNVIARLLYHPTHLVHQRNVTYRDPERMFTTTGNEIEKTFYILQNLIPEISNNNMSNQSETDLKIPPIGPIGKRYPLSTLSLMKKLLDFSQPLKENILSRRTSPSADFSNNTTSQQYYSGASYFQAEVQKILEKIRIECSNEVMSGPFSLDIVIKE